MIWLNLAKKYLALFATKNLDALVVMYDDTIDFNRIVGKDSVLQHHKKLFQYYSHISIRIDKSCYYDKYICFELSIKLDGVLNEEAWTIEFNDYGKIKSVHLYRRFI